MFDAPLLDLVYSGTQPPPPPAVGIWIECHSEAPESRTESIRRTCRIIASGSAEPSTAQMAGRPPFRAASLGGAQLVRRRTPAMASLMDATRRGHLPSYHYCFAATRAAAGTA